MYGIADYDVEVFFFFTFYLAQINWPRAVQILNV